MQTHLLFGFSDGDLEDARRKVERALGMTMDLRDSHYRGGRYYRLETSEREELRLQKNHDGPDDDDWMVPTRKDCAILLYVRHTDRADAIRSALADVAVFISESRVDRP
jgi:hypothetical protein